MSCLLIQFCKEGISQTTNLAPQKKIKTWICLHCTHMELKTKKVVNIPIQNSRPDSKEAYLGG